MIMKKITQEQKRIYIAFSIAFISLLVFTIFVYLPERKKLTLTRSMLLDAETDIEEITGLVKGKNLIEIVGDFDRQLKSIEDRLPYKPEDIMDDLSGEAGKLGIKTKHISFSQKKPVEKDIAGYKISELPVDMKLECEYRALGEYLKVLRSKEFPAVVRIEKLEIDGKGEGHIQLEVSLRAVVYLRQ
jgi:hypothetical protein